jgi:hypothetical protein
VPVPAEQTQVFDPLDRAADTGVAPGHAIGSDRSVFRYPERPSPLFRPVIASLSGAVKFRLAVDLQRRGEHRIETLL